MSRSFAIIIVYSYGRAPPCLQSLIPACAALGRPVRYSGNYLPRAAAKIDSGQEAGWTPIVAVRPREAWAGERADVAGWPVCCRRRAPVAVAAAAAAIVQPTAELSSCRHCATLFHGNFLLFTNNCNFYSQKS